MRTCNLQLRILDDGGVVLLNSFLAEDHTLSFGTGPGNDHILSGSDILPRHFEIGMDGSGVWVDDKSGGRTLIEGREVRGRMAAPAKFTIEAGTASLDVEVTLPSDVVVDPESLLGMEIGGYRMEEILGRGKVDVVYRATQVAMGREVAIKLLDPSQLAKNEVTRRFLRMIEISGQLNHPNLVQIHDSGFDKQRRLHYLVMERIEGSTLEQILLRTGRLPWNLVLDLLLQLGAGLEYLHQRGVVHRNLHPGSVFVLPGKQVKLIGLGFITRVEETAEASLDSPETIEESFYLAPEQFGGPGCDRRADLYALGALAHRALTGEMPALAPTLIGHFEAFKAGKRVPSLAGREDVPAKLAEILDRCLAPDPGQRYPSASALKADLRHLIAPTGVGRKTISRMQDHLSAMMPDSPDIPGFEAAVFFRPSQGVGGDFYDVFTIKDGDYGVVMGDVTGHGMEAIGVVGMAKMAIRILARRTSGPRNAMILAHRELMGDLVANTFVSALLVRISPTKRVLRYARAGHNPGILVNPRREDPVKLLDAPGMALGMFKNRNLLIEEQQVPLMPGDLLFLFTDGIVEASDLSGSLFGQNRLIAFLRSHYEDPPDRLAMELAGVLEQFTHESDPDRKREQDDDRTALILKLKPA